VVEFGTKTARRKGLGFRLVCFNFKMSQNLLCTKVPDLFYLDNQSSEKYIKK